MHEECCMCGSHEGVRYCSACGHDFCDKCRTKYLARGVEAMKTLLGHSVLRCGGQRHE
jgi:hypothetical protein